jgi:hypothetical protein
MLDDSTVRRYIYDEIVRTSESPSTTELAGHFGVAIEAIQDALRQMHDSHALVLQPSGEVLMANPFSAVPTPFVTEVGNRRWFANCIWDALGILAALHAEGRVLTSCGSCGDSLTLELRHGLLTGDGIAHFALPARRWWDDIVFN